MNKILIGGYVVGALQTNCWFLHREGQREAVVVDPGDSGALLAEAMEKEGLAVTAILLTHAHFDHIGGVREMVRATGAPVYLSESERLLDHDVTANLSSMYGHPTAVQPDVRLQDGEEVSLAGMTFRCIFTPGHTEGSCCYYIEETGTEDPGASPVGQSGEAVPDQSTGGGKACPPILLSGDTLFRESVGRTDFATGSARALERSIREKLYVLPDQTLVFPGHGAATGIGYEKIHNYVVPA